MADKSPAPARAGEAETPEPIEARCDACALRWPIIVTCWRCSGAKELAETTFERDALRQQLTEMTAELKVTDGLLVERQRVLDAIPPCPDHGPCVPHALEWIHRLALLTAGVQTIVNEYQVRAAELFAEADGMPESTKRAVMDAEAVVLDNVAIRLHALVEPQT